MFCHYSALKWLLGIVFWYTSSVLSVIAATLAAVLGVGVIFELKWIAVIVQQKFMNSSIKFIS